MRFNHHPSHRWEYDPIIMWRMIKNVHVHSEQWMIRVIQAGSSAQLSHNTLNPLHAPAGSNPSCAWHSWPAATASCSAPCSNSSSSVRLPLTLLSGLKLAGSLALHIHARQQLLFITLASHNPPRATPRHHLPYACTALYHGSCQKTTPTSEVLQHCWSHLHLQQHMNIFAYCRSGPGKGWTLQTHTKLVHPCEAEPCYHFGHAQYMINNTPPNRELCNKQRTNPVNHVRLPCIHMHMCTYVRQPLWTVS